MFLPHLFRSAKGIPLDSGIWPGLEGTVVPLWESGYNVWFNNKSVQKAKGYATAFASGVEDPIRGIGQQLVSGGQRMFFGTPSALYRWNTGSVSEMADGFSGVADATVTQRATLWSIENWGEWMVAANGVDAVQVYKGTEFAALANTTFTWAEILVKMGPYLLALNTSNGRSTYEWCHEDNIELWTPASDNTAGNNTIRDMPSEMVCAAPLGTRTAVYGTNTMHLISRVGAPFIFGHAFAMKGVGALSKRSVIAVGALNYGWGPLGIFLTDGVQHHYLDEPGIRAYLQSRLNTAQASKVTAYHNEEAGQVIWSYPAGVNTEPSEAVGFDYKRKVFTFYNYAFSDAAAKEVFGYPILGLSSGGIAYANFGVNADGEALPARIVTKPLGWDAQKIKYFDALTMEASVTGNVNVDARVFERLDDAEVWTTLGQLNASGDPLYLEQSGRWLALRIDLTEEDADFEVGHINLLGKLLGGEL